MILWLKLNFALHPVVRCCRYINFINEVIHDLLLKLNFALHLVSCDYVIEVANCNYNLFVAFCNQMEAVIWTAYPLPVTASIPIFMSWSRSLSQEGIFWKTQWPNPGSKVRLCMTQDIV